MKIHLQIKEFLYMKPLQILLLILTFAGIVPHLTYNQCNILYTISMVIKESLLFILPFTIFSYIASSLIQFKNKAGLLVGVIIIFEGVSNASSVFYAYGLHQILPLYFKIDLNGIEVRKLTSYINISQYKPLWWKAERGAIFGLMLGLYVIYSRRKQFWFRYINKCKDITDVLLTKIFTKLIFFLIPGFIASLIYSNMFTFLLINTKEMFLMMIFAMIFYILFLYLIGANFDFKNMLKKSFNALPSMVTAFTTMCSITTMPITIENAKKNLQKPYYASTVIPMTTNIQMIGDCFVNAFLCLMVIKIFHQTIPDFIDWSKFVLIFTLVRYATAGVSGGTTFLLLPLYEKYLNFNNEMLAMMLTFNIILDPFITAANVYANGALIIIFEKVFNFIEEFLKKMRIINDNKVTKSDYI